ncbi:cytochrome c [Psychrobium sp. 1_MG-2023]|uniref:c-type cytochrome n=1 Tax=Psychrobium sp. 1_MG-2023 TaxID=3062624 RepID=UPI000C34971C|nr:cytochrome c [Psychrobium sp. 1_MG-2023]MDP2561082.1 cytochrome c [Psychrobium sp. 1_MG-2023]PKF58371.1 cytochrome C [Alteromonadales bacterium alter-6D02]
MNLVKKGAIACAIALVATSSFAAQPAKSEKHAAKATEWRKDVFQLIYSNMGPMGAMAKGKIPLDKAVVEKNAMRINQLSYMIGDYFKVDTRKFDVNTETLDKVWESPAQFDKKITALTLASANLQKVVQTGNEGAIKKAIGGIGKSCGSCHDDFKQD